MPLRAWEQELAGSDPLQLREVLPVIAKYEGGADPMIAVCPGCLCVTSDLSDNHR